MTFNDLINTATLADAKSWEATNEQFIFCIDFLEISASRRNADFLVTMLEVRFTELLENTP